MKYVIQPFQCHFSELNNHLKTLFYFISGIPVRSLVTVWPKRSDFGFFVEVIRILFHVYRWYFAGAMVMCDGICITALVVLCYKFRTLQVYFQVWYKIYLTKRSLHHAICRMQSRVSTLDRIKNNKVHDFQPA